MSLLAVRCLVKLSPQRAVGLCAAVGNSLWQTANITTPGPGEKPPQRERKPFDYRRKRFTMLHQPFDRTLARMDENSKVIIVDGPIASGKTEFARKLAQALDFKFVPQPDPYYLYECGHGSNLNYQDLDDLLPPEHRVYTLERFLKDEDATLAAGEARPGALQLDFYVARLYTYNDALLHLYSTGQGVVCVRSPWSDRVFAKALLDNGYISPKGFSYYKDEVVYQSNFEYPRPHLVIYLDADVEETKENIRSRNNELEVNSKIFTDSFLESMENDYKDVVLPAVETHSELLVYPSIPEITENEIELVVEDIEALGPMAHSGISDDHFLDDWRYLRDEELAHQRRRYQDLELANMALHHSKPWSSPEMLCDVYYEHARGDFYDAIPGYKRDPGYDPKLQPWWKIALGISGRKFPEDRRRFWVPA